MSKFSDKLREEMPEFVAEVLSAKDADLDARLAELAKGLEEVRNSQEEDEGLAEAKAKATELGAPYRESKKAISAKSRFIVEVLKERGKS